MSQEGRTTTLIDSLPIDSVIADVASALASDGAAVLRAPPGAGKTTRLPLALLNAEWLRGGRIILLEPRRLAARAAASRMADTLGEPVGATVGYRMHMDTRVSAETRIEVVTEGVLTRMLQSDPSLEGVSLVIFDEFHERSIHADVGLTLTLHARSLFRPDLRVLIMSATLDTDVVARTLGDPPIVTSEGRAWPVETRFLDRPVEGFVDSATARTVMGALRGHDGDALVFLPGAAEIRRVESILRDSVPPDTDVYPLYGQLAQNIQDRALAPSPSGRRKVVLATSIAQTSLTIEGVRIVVDSGQMRVPRFSVRTGMTRLETVRVTRATAEQRRGRAGRTAPGICYRMWTSSEDAGLVPYDAPEILETDLAPLALELAAWGITDPAELTWIDPPPAAGLQRARELMAALHAIDAAGNVTAHGRSLSALGVHPRLAHMLLRGAHAGHAHLACDVAAILRERDLFRNDFRDPDMRLRVDALRGRDSRADPAALQRVRRDAAQLHTWLDRALDTRTSRVPRADAGSDYAGLMIAFAYPDRIAQQRTPTGRGASRFLMSNGRGAALDGATPLTACDLLAVASLDDTGRDARIQLAAPLDRAELEKYFAEDIHTGELIEWDEESDSARAYRTRTFGSIVLERVRIANPDTDVSAALVLAAIRRNGAAAMPWPDDLKSLRARVLFARHAAAGEWPDLSDDALMDGLATWLLPFIPDVRSMSEITPATLRAAIGSLLPYAKQRELDEIAPAHFVAPTGSHLDIDYSDPAAPAVAVRLQELFGLAVSPPWRMAPCL